ncbi:MAG: hypothetical protein ACQEQF_00615 [Bacillota bacterium]
MGMNTNLIKKLDKMVEKKVPAPDLSNYDLIADGNGSFNELYNADEKFTQVIICNNNDNTEKWYTVKGFDAYHEIKKLFKEYDEKREKVRKKVAKDNFEREYQIENYLMLSKLSSFGKRVKLFKRFKPEEKAMEIDEKIEHQRLMEKDEQYRKNQEWLNEEYRPFGGAFASQEDFQRYKGI